MRNYETLVLFSPEAEETLDERVKALRSILDRSGAVEVREERVGRRRLAYPVARKEAGVYVLFEYRAPAEAPRKIREACALDEGILRQMTVLRSERRSKPAPAEAKKKRRLAQ